MESQKTTTFTCSHASLVRPAFMLLYLIQLLSSKLSAWN